MIEMNQVLSSHLVFSVLVYRVDLAYGEEFSLEFYDSTVFLKDESM